MRWMFSRCSSLEELNLLNFNIDNITDTNFMFFKCSYKLKKKIKEQNKNLNI